jgi:hypothetical protein
MKLACGYHSSTVTVNGGIFSMGRSWNEKTENTAQNDVNSFFGGFATGYSNCSLIFSFLG